MLTLLFLAYFRYTATYQNGKIEYDGDHIGEMKSQRGGHGCAYIIIGGRHYIYVTGGFHMSTKNPYRVEKSIFRTTEYFDLADGTWHNGKFS